MIDRRTFLAGTGAVLLAAPLAAEAQKSGKEWRIGVLAVQSPEAPPGSIPILALRQGLRDFGYVEGQNIVVEWRWAHGKPERFPDLAAELVRLNVDIIVASVNSAVQAAQRATRTIPIVMVYSSDPIGPGFAASLARPGGNITGMTVQAPDVAGKGLQLLKEVVPKASRIALLTNPSEPGRRDDIRETEAAARTLGVTFRVLEARNGDELAPAFAVMVRDRVGGVVIEAGAMTYGQRLVIAQLAVTHRLPTMCLVREYAEAGCLLSYGPNLSDVARRAASFVDKILRGAQPRDLPIEQPRKFELVINLKTAKALGLTIPPSVLGRADEVIQ